MIQPPNIQPGDTIGLVCPAGSIPIEKVQNCIQTLEKWGYRVQLGKTVGSKKDCFSATDMERMQDVQAMLDDENIKAIICARGGYGMSRIIGALNFSKFNTHPKWVVGFSDITVLHGYMHEQLKISSIHGPMAGAFNVDEGESRYTLSLKDTLEGKPVVYLSKAHELNKQGTVKAEMIGGNLCLLAHGIGTNAQIDTKGKILFIEDIGEQLYNIDRMMLQLKRAGMLKKLKGLVVGGFTDNKDTERTFGKTAYQIIYEAVEEYKYPRCFGFPISHEKENVAIQIGAKYKLIIDETQVTLSSL